MFKDEKTLLEILLARKNQTYGPDKLREALFSLGNPELNLKVIQIGGTNGKGSTTNYLRAILQNEGYQVGTFTSPHLITHRDRIRINDEMISANDFINYANLTLPLWERYQLSMFEIDFLISVLYFIDKKVDYVIYEVGLGGRLDATSVLRPQIIGITNVSYDHMHILGDSLAEIAFEKAGIFKENTPIFTNEDKEEVLTVFKQQAEKCHSRLNILQPVSFEKGKQNLLINTPVSYTLKNQGVYQVYNSQLALHIVDALGISLSNAATAIESTQWAGRFEEVLPNVFIDGAHNKAGIDALVETLDNYPKPWTIVFSVLKDKDYPHMIHQLYSISDQFILTEFDFPRALKLVEVKDDNLIKITNYKKAINTALTSQNGGTVIITGSLYFISLARTYLLEM